MILLNEIKKDMPILFKNMNQAPNWIIETSIPNVFFSANALLDDRLGRKTSYGYLFQYALEDTKSILEYMYKVDEKQPLKSFKSDILFKGRFKKVFEEMQRRYGILFERDSEGHLGIKMTKDASSTMPLSKFSYDKKEQVLTETRNDGQIEKKSWTFRQTNVERDAFIDYLYRNNLKEQR